MAGSQSLADSAQTTSLDPFYGTPYMDSYGNTYTGEPLGPCVSIHFAVAATEGLWLTRSR
eukprot:2803611-Rhodomonas_salina.1